MRMNLLPDHSRVPNPTIDEEWGLDDGVYLEQLPYTYENLEQLLTGGADDLSVGDILRTKESHKSGKIKETNVLTAKGKEIAQSMFNDLYVRYNGDLTEVRNTLLEDHANARIRYADNPEVLQRYLRIYQSMHARLQYMVSSEIAASFTGKDAEELGFKEVLEYGKGDEGASYEQRLENLRRGQEIKIASELARTEIETEQLIFEAQKAAAQEADEHAQNREPHDAGALFRKFTGGIRSKARQGVLLAMTAVTAATLLAGSVGYRGNYESIENEPQKIEWVYEDAPTSSAGVPHTPIPQETLALLDPPDVEMDEPIEIPPREVQMWYQGYQRDGTLREGPWTDPETGLIIPDIPPAEVQMWEQGYNPDGTSGPGNELRDQAVFEKNVSRFEGIGAEITHYENGEVEIQMPSYPFELFYGGAVGDGVQWGSEWYEGKEHNAEVTVDSFNEYMKDKVLHPGDEIGLIRDIVRFSNPNYIDAGSIFASGACWPGANLGGTLDRLNEELGFPVFEVQGVKHGKKYMSYTFPEDRADPAKWDGGYTIEAVADGVPKGDGELMFRVNPDLASFFPGYSVGVSLRQDFYQGTGKDDPSHVETTVILHLDKDNQEQDRSGVIVSEGPEVARIIEHRISNTGRMDEAVRYTENYREHDIDHERLEWGEPKEIILHWDGNLSADPNDWRTNVTYNGLNREVTDPRTGEKTQLSAHFAVGVDGVLQMMPMREGEVPNSQAAYGYYNHEINIEMGGAYFTVYPDGSTNVPESEVTAVVDLISKLLIQYNLPLKALVGHYERDTEIIDGKPFDRGKPDPGPEFLEYVRNRVAQNLQSMGIDPNELGQPLPSGELALAGYGTTKNLNSLVPTRVVVSSDNRRYDGWTIGQAEVEQVYEGKGPTKAQTVKKGKAQRHKQNDQMVNARAQAAAFRNSMNRRGNA